MILLSVDRQSATLQGCPRFALAELDRRLSYPVEGAWFARSYRTGHWDGRVHLLRLKKGVGYSLPIGLLPDVITALDNLSEPYRVEGSRSLKSEHTIGISWKTERDPRPYQRKAIDAFLKGRNGIPCLGILRMPIRSGKTFTAALLIKTLKMRALFVVPSTLLLDQTAETFVECFGGDNVGTIGDGKRLVKDVTVATYQSLMAGYRAKDALIHDLLRSVGLLIVDECHHLEAEEWRKPLLKCTAVARVGLSATAYVSARKPNERSAIWLKAICGPIVYDVTMRYLVERGWLVPPTVEFHKVTTPVTDERWSASLYDRLITQNGERNALIVRQALRAKGEGRSCLIDVGRVKHGRILLGLLRRAGLSAVFLHGKDDDATRGKTIAALRKGELDTLVSTLLGEGVDVPELEVVINAEGGAQRKSTIQRCRNLTPAEGKTSARIVEFADLTSPYLAKHTAERLKAYEAERCFDVSVMNGDSTDSSTGDQR